MLNETEIQRALHASRVVPLAVTNPHGPLGLEHLAAAVSQIAGPPHAVTHLGRVRRFIELNAETWEKLDHLADTTAKTLSRPVTASEVAAGIIEQFVATTQSP
jgi:hypothetical protein